MKREANLINELLTTLPAKLGDKYSVEVPLSYNFEPGPDLIIENKDTGFKTLIELKGGNSNDELPYAVIPSLRKIFTSYKANDSKFILISSSKVSNTIKEFLSQDKIELVEMPNESDISGKIEEIVMKAG